MKYLILVFIFWNLTTRLSAQIEAAFTLSENVVVFISGDRVVKFNMVTNMEESNALLGQGALPGISFSKIDAALNFGNGKVYLFSGENYIRFDVATYKADEGYPKRTADYWPGVNFQEIGAAMNWTKRSYFFSEGYYSKYLLSENKVSEGYPKKLSESSWPGLIFPKVDAAFSRNGKTYFFSGNEFAVYDNTLQKVDVGYPKKLTQWPSLYDAFNSQKVMNATLSAKPNSVKESSITLTLGDSRVTFNNRSDIVYDKDENPVLIYSFEKDGTYIQPLNNYWVSKSNVIAIKGVYFYDMVIVDDYYYVLAKELAGYSGHGCLKYEEEGNVLLLMKINKNGTVISKRKIMGHEGVKGGQYFLCTYSSHGKLKYDGKNFHVFFETCGNFSSKGSSEFDIHEGDYYIMMSKDGDIISESPWNHSHSGLVQLVTDGVGEAITLSISDGYPWGLGFLRFSNGKMVSNEVLFPDKDNLPFKNMGAVGKSTTDAGEIGGLVKIGDYFYTIMATVPTAMQPVLEQKKNLLFLKFDRNGKVLISKWLGNTSLLDESVPFVTVYGDKIFLAYMLKTGEYEHNHKASFAIVNTEGDYVVLPKDTDFPLDWQSRMVNFPNGDVGIVDVTPYSSEVTITRFGEELLPSKANPSDADNMSRNSRGVNATVKPLMPKEETQGTISLDLTKTPEENKRFNGSYMVKSGSVSSDGVYCEGVYEAFDADFSIFFDEFDYSNFTITADFKVGEFRHGVVFSLSGSYRMINFELMEDGYLMLKVNNGEKRLTSEVKYNLNQWHKAKIKVVGNAITMYLDDKQVMRTNAMLKGVADLKGADISTTGFGSALTFKGYLRHFEVGKANE